MASQARLSSAGRTSDWGATRPRSSAGAGGRPSQDRSSQVRGSRMFSVGFRLSQALGTDAQDAIPDAAAVKRAADHAMRSKMAAERQRRGIVTLYDEAGGLGGEFNQPATRGAMAGNPDDDIRDLRGAERRVRRDGGAAAFSDRVRAADDEGILTERVVYSNNQGRGGHYDSERVKALQLEPGHILRGATASELKALLVEDMQALAARDISLLDVKALMARATKENAWTWRGDGRYLVDTRPAGAAPRGMHRALRQQQERVMPADKLAAADRIERLRGRPQPSATLAPTSRGSPGSKAAGDTTVLADADAAAAAGSGPDDGSHAEDPMFAAAEELYGKQEAIRLRSKAKQKAQRDQRRDAAMGRRERTALDRIYQEFRGGIEDTLPEERASKHGATLSRIRGDTREPVDGPSTEDVVAALTAQRRLRVARQRAEAEQAALTGARQRADHMGQLQVHTAGQAPRVQRRASAGAAMLRRSRPMTSTLITPAIAIGGKPTNSPETESETSAPVEQAPTAGVIEQAPTAGVIEQAPTAGVIEQAPTASNRVAMAVASAVEVMSLAAARPVAGDGQSVGLARGLVGVKNRTLTALGVMPGTGDDRKMAVLVVDDQGRYRVMLPDGRLERGPPAAGTGTDHVGLAGAALHDVELEPGVDPAIAARAIAAAQVSSAGSKRAPRSVRTVVRRTLLQPLLQWRRGRTAALQIQRVWRGYAARIRTALIRVRLFRRRRELAARLIQTVWKANYELRMQREEYLKRQSAAFTIQACAWRIRTRAFARQRKARESIGMWVWGVVTQQRLRGIVAAVRARRHAEREGKRRASKELRKKQEWVATKLQARFRGWMARDRFRRLLRVRNWAAGKIGRWMMLLHEKQSLIDDAVRPAMEELQAARAAAKRIQSTWKMMRARRAFRDMVKRLTPAALRIQTAIRAYLARVLAEEMRRRSELAWSWLGLHRPLEHYESARPSAKLGLATVAVAPLSRDADGFVIREQASSSGLNRDDAVSMQALWNARGPLRGDGTKLSDSDQQDGTDSNTAVVRGPVKLKSGLLGDRMVEASRAVAIQEEALAQAATASARQERVAMLVRMGVDAAEAEAIAAKEMGLKGTGVVTTAIQGESSDDEENGLNAFVDNPISALGPVPGHMRPTTRPAVNDGPSAAGDTLAQDGKPRVSTGLPKALPPDIFKAKAALDKAESALREAEKGSLGAPAPGDELFSPASSGAGKRPPSAKGDLQSLSDYQLETTGTDPIGYGTTSGDELAQSGNESAGSSRPRRKSGIVRATKSVVVGRVAGMIAGFDAASDPAVVAKATAKASKTAAHRRRERAVRSAEIRRRARNSAVTKSHGNEEQGKRRDKLQHKPSHAKRLAEVRASQRKRAATQLLIVDADTEHRERRRAKEISAAMRSPSLHRSIRSLGALAASTSSVQALEASLRAPGDVSLSTAAEEYERQSSTAAEEYERQSSTAASDYGSTVWQLESRDGVSSRSEIGKSALPGLQLLHRGGETSPLIGTAGGMFLHRSSGEGDERTQNKTQRHSTMKHNTMVRHGNHHIDGLKAPEWDQAVTQLVPLKRVSNDLVRARDMTDSWKSQAPHLRGDGDSKAKRERMRRRLQAARQREEEALQGGTSMVMLERSEAEQLGKETVFRADLWVDEVGGRRRKTAKKHSHQQIRSGTHGGAARPMEPHRNVGPLEAFAVVRTKARRQRQQQLARKTASIQRKTASMSALDKPASVLKFSPDLQASREAHSNYGVAPRWAAHATGDTRGWKAQRAAVLQAQGSGTYVPAGGGDLASHGAHDIATIGQAVVPDEDWVAHNQEHKDAVRLTEGKVNEEIKGIGAGDTHKMLEKPQRLAKAHRATISIESRATGAANVLELPALGWRAKSQQRAMLGAIGVSNKGTAGIDRESILSGGGGKLLAGFGAAVAPAANVLSPAARQRARHATMPRGERGVENATRAGTIAQAVRQQSKPVTSGHGSNSESQAATAGGNLTIARTIASGGAPPTRFARVPDREGSAQVTQTKAALKALPTNAAGIPMLDSNGGTGVAALIKSLRMATELERKTANQQREAAVDRLTALSAAGIETG